MLRSLITDALSTEGGVTLAAIATRDLATWSAAPAPDVVFVTTSDPHRSEVMGRLLWQWPRSRVVAVAQSGRDGALWELAPQKTPLGELCPATLVDIVHGGRR